MRNLIHKVESPFLNSTISKHLPSPEKFLQLSKPLIIAAVLLASWKLGVSASIQIALLSLLALIALLGLVFFTRVPPLGMLALLIAALNIPFTLATQSQTAISATVITISILLMIWLFDGVRARQLTIVSSPTNLPLMLLIVSVLLSFVVGLLIWNPFASLAPMRAQIGALAIYLLSYGTFLLAGNRITSEKWLKFLVLYFLAMAFLPISAKLYNPLYLISDLIVVHSQSMSSSLWIWIVALAAGQALFNVEFSSSKRFLFLGLAVLTLWINWNGRDWASGWLPPLVVFFVLISLRSWRLGVLMALAGILFLFWIRPDFLQTLIQNDLYSISTRDIAGRILIEQVLPLNPILGLGPGNYYWYAPLYPIEGYHIVFNSHNNYVDILLQTGLLGMAIFLWLIVAVGLLGWNLRNKVGWGFARGYVYGCLGGLAGSLAAMFLADWFLPFAYNVGLRGLHTSLLGWFFLGGLVAVKQIYRVE